VAKKRRKPTDKTLLRDKLDRVFSKWVRFSGLDAQGLATCYTCGTRKPPEDMHAGHYVSRRHMSTRWEVWNVRVQCPYCNTYMEGQRQAYREHLVADYGERQVADWEATRNIVKQWTVEELQEKIATFDRLAKAVAPRNLCDTY
jgi:5-methylcytosine-specific restriction endonuclease McrA